MFEVFERALKEDVRRRDLYFTIYIERDLFINRIKRGEGGGSFLPAANLNLSYFWTTCGMNMKIYDFSLLLLEIILLQKKSQKIYFQGVIYFFTGGIVNK